MRDRLKFNAHSMHFRFPSRNKNFKLKISLKFSSILLDSQRRKYLPKAFAFTVRISKKSSWILLHYVLWIWNTCFCASLWPFWSAALNKFHQDFLLQRKMRLRVAPKLSLLKGSHLHFQSIKEDSGGLYCIFLKYADFLFWFRCLKLIKSK